MNKLQKLRIALIGLGDIAQKAYLPIVANNSKVSPILCTRNAKVLKQLAERYRIDETYSDISTLIKQRPDAVMIHSSTESHFELVSRFLHAGIPVFVDKPLCYSLDEAEILLNLASQKQVLLYLGFNRRFAPLIKALHKEQNPIQINWQKNRVNLAADARSFIFDDFIHVADSLRFLAEGVIDNLQVFSQSHKGQLEALQVQWQQNETLLTGAMNRISGITQERVEYYTRGNKWEIDALVSGVHYQNGKQQPLVFDNWENTLYKRGFIDLFDDWLKALQSSKYDTGRIQDIWETHNLCEAIVNKIN